MALPVGPLFPMNLFCLFFHFLNWDVLIMFSTVVMSEEGSLVISCFSLMLILLYVEDWIRWVIEGSLTFSVCSFSLLLSLFFLLYLEISPVILSGRTVIHSLDHLPTTMLCIWNATWSCPVLQLFLWCHCDSAGCQHMQKWLWRVFHWCLRIIWILGEALTLLGTRSFTGLESISVVAPELVTAASSLPGSEEASVFLPSSPFSLSASV